MVFYKESKCIFAFYYQKVIISSKRVLNLLEIRKVGEPKKVSSPRGTGAGIWSGGGGAQEEGFSLQNDGFVSKT